MSCPNRYLAACRLPARLFASYLELQLRFAIELRVLPQASSLPQSNVSKIQVADFGLARSLREVDNKADAATNDDKVEATMTDYVATRW